MLDTRWLDDLPAGDHLGLLDAVQKRLQDLSVQEVKPNQAMMRALMAIDHRSAPSVAALTLQYCRAPTLPVEVDERLWQCVVSHYRILASNYQRLLDAYVGQGDHGLDAADLPHILLNLMDCQRNLVKWRYFRYQPMVEGGWLKLHGLYQLAESRGCALTSVSRYPDTPHATIMACYLETLMLGTLNHTNMQKVEIELLASWLGWWCSGITLSADYDAARHLFFVNLNEDRSGRRLRNTEPAADYRYWELDAVEQQIVGLKQSLTQPGQSKLALLQGVRQADALNLIEHLLGEWSRNDYQRQRRLDEREGVEKLAQLVNGILNVCQQVKNVAYARVRGREGHFEATPIGADAISVSDDSEPGVASAGGGAEKWHIENESRYGLGAVVNAELNLWLKPGKLIALDDQFNHDMTPVGVVRSIKQLGGNQRYVGIELLSHTPAYVRMRSLAAAREYFAADIFTAATLTTQGPPPFPALYLPKDEERAIPSSLLMPVIEFVDGGYYELRTDRSAYQVRLGQVMEQKDDWVRVQAVMLEKPPAAAA